MISIDKARNEGSTYTAKLHWIVMVIPGAVAFGIALLGAGLTKDAIHGSREPMATLGVAFLTPALTVVGLSYWKMRSTRLTVTNSRILLRSGLLTRRSLEVLFSKLESVSVRQTTVGRILAFGTITVRGIGGGEEVFPNIAHPEAFRRKVQQEMAPADNSDTLTISIRLPRSNWTAHAS